MQCIIWTQGGVLVYFKALITGQSINNVVGKSKLENKLKAFSKEFDLVLMVIVKLYVTDVFSRWLFHVHKVNLAACYILASFKIFRNSMLIKV